MINDQNAERAIPSRGYTKLDSGIVYSTVWMQSHDTLRAWIALLVLADATGLVRSSVPALAHLCFIKPDRMREIIQSFEDPDPDSRIQDYEGRKIQAIEGGWLILNYLRYRNLCQRKPGSHAERQAKYRGRKKGDTV
jgi:hypothetical protein